MSVGTLNGQPFDVDPESIAYHFDLKASATPTVGGKVVQVFGTRVSNMTVSGSFGIAGLAAQQKFLAEITLQMGEQRGGLGPGGYVQGQSIRFTFPPRNYDLQVYVLNYSQPGTNFSVALDNEIINPQWELEFFIVNDNAGTLAPVANASINSYLNRLMEGLGWNPNEYNSTALEENQNASSPTSVAAAIVGPASPQAQANNGAVTPNGSGGINANGYSY